MDCGSSRWSTTGIATSVVALESRWFPIDTWEIDSRWRLRSRLPNNCSKLADRLTSCVPGIRRLTVEGWSSDFSISCLPRLLRHVQIIDTNNPAMTIPTTTNTPATFPVDSQNEDLSTGTGEVSDWFAGKGLEAVMVGLLGMKLVTTTVVPWLTVMVAIDCVRDVSASSEDMVKLQMTARWLLSFGQSERN